MFELIGNGSARLYRMISLHTGGHGLFITSNYHILRITELEILEV